MTGRRLALVLLAGLLCAGCAQPREPGENAIVRMLAIDRSAQGVQVSLQLLDPLLAAQNEGAPAQGTRVLSQSGEDLTQALEACRLACGRQLYMGDCRLVLLGESLLHPEEILRWLARQGQVYPRLPILRAQGSAGELAKLPLEFERLSADELEAVYTLACQRQALPQSSLLALVDALEYPGQRPLMGVLALDEGGEAVQIRPAGGVLLGGEPTVVSQQALAGISLLRGEKGRRVLPLDDGSLGGHSVELDSVRLRIQPQRVGGHLRLRVHCRARAALGGDGVLRERLRQELLGQLDAALALTFSPDGGDCWGLIRLASARFPEYRGAQGENWDGVLRGGSAELTVELLDADAAAGQRN